MDPQDAVVAGELPQALPLGRGERPDVVVAGFEVGHLGGSLGLRIRSRMSRNPPLPPPSFICSSRLASGTILGAAKVPRTKNGTTTRPWSSVKKPPSGLRLEMRWLASGEKTAVPSKFNSSSRLKPPAATMFKSGERKVRSSVRTQPAAAAALVEPELNGVAGNDLVGDRDRSRHRAQRQRPVLDLVELELPAPAQPREPVARLFLGVDHGQEKLGDAPPLRRRGG